MVIMGLGWDTKNNKIRVPQIVYTTGHIYKVSYLGKFLFYLALGPL